MDVARRTDAGDRRILLGIDLVVLVVAAGLGFYWPFGNGDRELRLPGVVEMREVRLGSKVGGRVAEVLVEEGEVIGPGKVLVRLEAPEIKAQLEQLQAKLVNAQWTLKRAENGPRQQEKTHGR